MFVFTFKWNKKLALLIIIVAAVLLCAVILSISGGQKHGTGTSTTVKTNEDRIKFLGNLGWEVDSNPIEEKSITIPKKFSNVYENYNKLQQEQGFDLSQYGGLDATIYTYTVSNYNGYVGTVVADLYVMNYQIIGGDVHSTALNGFMHGLYKK